MIPRALKVLASLVSDAAEGLVLTPMCDSAADRLWATAARRPSPNADLTEVAEHLGAIRALLEDSRNLLVQLSQLGTPSGANPLDLAFGAFPGFLGAVAPDLTQPSVATNAVAACAAAASAEADLSISGKCLRVAARGLRSWIKGEPCTGPAYWGSVAAALDRVAQTQDAIQLANK